MVLSRSIVTLRQATRCRASCLYFHASASHRSSHVTRSLYTRIPPSRAQPASTSTANAAANEKAVKAAPEPLPDISTNNDPARIDWSKSFHGLSSEAFPKEAADILLKELNPEWIEIKPDGIIYLPEIHYRRILNRAFGPGGWGLAPRGEAIVTDKAVTREYALVANGRYDITSTL